MTDETLSRYAECIPIGIVALGATLFTVDLGATLYFNGFDGVSSAAGLVGRVTSGTFCLGITVGGYWLRRSDLDPTRYRRVGGWVVSFAVAFLGINLLLIAFIPADSLYGNLAWALFAFYTGAAGGVVVGTVEARAIGHAVEAERNAVRTEHLETQRQWLDYLNSLLRHEVLNNASIIQGYATLLLEEEDLPSPAHQYAETIHRQSQDMTDVIGDVRVLVRAVEHSVELSAVDVVDVVVDELEDLEATYVDVESELSPDDDAYVLADDLLPRIFSNLLSNAVEHNPGDSPRVTVDVETEPKSVRVEVADDGPGVPDDEREALFERGKEDHGLGLYLVRVLADRYGGTVELVETGPGGSVFAVELPRADPPAEDDADDAPDGEPSAADSGGADSGAENPGAAERAGPIR